MALDIKKLKKGDIFADGFYRENLEFVKVQGENVHAKDGSEKVVIPIRNLESNGYLFPLLEIGEFSVGLPGERRNEKLTLIKTLLKDIKPNDLFCSFRKDRHSLLYTLEPFSEYCMNGTQRDDLAKGDWTQSLNTYLYIVKDKDFSEKESLRVDAIEKEEKQRQLIRAVKIAEENLLFAKKKLQDFLGIN